MTVEASVTQAPCDEDSVVAANEPDNATLRREFSAAVIHGRSRRPSANRTRPRSMSCVSHSVRGEFGSRDLRSRCDADGGRI